MKINMEMDSKNFGYRISDIGKIFDLPPVIMSDFTLFGPILKVPLSGSVHCSSRISVLLACPGDIALGAEVAAAV
jgi:hypothetical protein